MMRHGITSRLCVCSGSNNNVCNKGKKILPEVGFEPTPPDGDQNTRSADTA